MISAIRSTGFSENYSAIHARAIRNRARHVVFGKIVVMFRAFCTWARHVTHHHTHHPLNPCYSVSPILHHIIFKKKNINIYMLLNAYIGRYIRKQPWTLVQH